MKNGQVSTPSQIVDLIVGKLFERRAPTREDTLLDPGCGSGAFIKGVLAWCQQNRAEIPRIVGVDIDPALISAASKSISDSEHVRLLNEDFLLGDFGDFDFIIGNPPYLRLEALSRADRKKYREQFETARNRFDLYILFFEKENEVICFEKMTRTEFEELVARDPGAMVIAFTRVCGLSDREFSRLFKLDSVYRLRESWHNDEASRTIFTNAIMSLLPKRMYVETFLFTFYKMWEEHQKRHYRARFEEDSVPFSGRKAMNAQR